jgi:hypothetical protein
MLPAEGRDYQTEVTVGQDGSLQVQMKGLTKFGDLFAKYCMAGMKDKLTELGAAEVKSDKASAMALSKAFSSAFKGVKGNIGGKSCGRRKRRKQGTKGNRREACSPGGNSAVVSTQHVL